MLAVIAILFGVACADLSWMQEHTDTVQTFNDRSYSDISVAFEKDFTLKLRMNQFEDMTHDQLRRYVNREDGVDSLITDEEPLDLNHLVTKVSESPDRTGHHWDPCNTCSKHSDQKLADLRCNDPYFDARQGFYFNINFDDTSNTIYFILASLAIFLFCGAFVSKPITSSIVLQTLAFIIIPFASAIDVNFELTDYSLPYDNYGSAYGTTSDGTMYMIGGGGQQNTIVKWNPSVNPYRFTKIVLNTPVMCYHTSGAMIKAYDGHEYLFIIGTYLSGNVLIFNTTSDTFVDHNIAAVAKDAGCVSTDGASKIYYSGGRGASNQMAVLDVSTSIVSATWEALKSATIGRNHHYCFYLNGVHYDFTGNGRTDSWKYNVVANDWTKMDYTFDTTHVAGRTIYWPEKRVALLVGGTKIAGGTSQKMSFIFDPSTEIMTELYQLQEARKHCSLSIVDDTLYVVGGYPVSSIEVADFTTDPPTKAPTDEPTAAPTVECVWECVPVDVCLGSDNYNIVFVLDESGSVTSTNYEISLQFVQTLIAEDVNDDSRVSVITFSDDQETIYSLAGNQNDGRVSVNAALENEKDDSNYDGGSTDTLNAVIAGMDEIKQNGDYTNNILILITDGTPSCGEDDPDCNPNVCDVDLISEIEEYGVTVIIIGVTDEFDSADVSCLSSEIIEIEEYTSDYFESIKDDIRDVTCTSDGGESAAHTIGDDVDAFQYIKSVSGRDHWTDFDLIAVFTMVCVCSCLFFAMGCYWGSKTKKLDPVKYDSVDPEN